MKTLFVQFARSLNMRDYIMATVVLFVPFLGMAQADQYKVIKIQGEIQRVKTGNLLSTGEEFRSDENLNFRTDYSRAAVINPQKGRFILTARASGEGAGAQFLPPSSNMSVRATKMAKPDEVLDYYFGEVLILGNDQLAVDDNIIAQGANAYFELSFTTDGQRFEQKLNVKDGVIMLPYQLLTEHKPIIVELAYHDAMGATQKTEFTPIYPSSKDIATEISIIVNGTSGDNNDKVKEVASFLNDFYGKTTIETVDAWMKQNIK